MECVRKFCYLGHIFGSCGGVKEADRASMKCVWAKFKELSSVLTAPRASYHIKGEICDL